METTKIKIKPRIRSRYDFELKKEDCETVLGKSETIQNDSFSIQDILDKFTRGIDPGIKMQGYYTDEEPDFDDEDLEKVTRQEKTEIYRTGIEATENAKNAKNTLTEQKKQAEKARLEAEKAEKEGKANL